VNTAGTGPREGFRVVDLSVAAAAPFATSILADQGADVIKIERPEGDFMRNVGTMRNGVAAVFAALNHTKRAICIDLKDPRGLAILHRLVADADVFVHNLRPGIAARLGVDYDTLRAVRTDLVYLAISGWGEHGPHASRPAYDSVVQAASGVAANQGGPGGAPQFVRNTICDKGTGLTAAQLVTAALLARERSGRGQQIHVSMLQSSIAFLWPDGMQNVTFLDGSDDDAKATPPPLHRTADGWMSITAMLDTEFQGLCRVLGVDELLEEPRFADRGARSRHYAAMWSHLDPRIATWESVALAERLAAVGVPHAVVRSVETIHEDPQVVAGDLLVEITHPVAGPMRVPRPVGAFSDAPLTAPRPAPAVGQDTDAILAEVGYTPEQRDELRAAQVVR
jgi:crotonobetainyl-CoA:carnitine CoA-transferase CaiB-like acyl-CoA transferase